MEKNINIMVQILVAENDSLLHTQLWIDPAEEFVQYAHNGNPADVTFAVKELKAFLAFCEGCEMDIHLYFEKAGNYMKVTLDLQQMECQARPILGKLLENI
ncbi:uncharacterized protein LOC104415584 [Eucalyptus grandis]|uniref:uncharacterized protein LOC104415584 n=1 Tax=Eucalyptus grandis TaxID=71139 RepID=UPI00192E863C|nr:uncharacterized protein LOC104415584 [Eucalyptus grandis]XP_039155058.1 uncharacterized protein LOC104415584 [Eucalyptus grandis]